MKKLICWLTLLCLALVPTLSALAETADSAHTIESKQLTFYYGDADTKLENAIYFIDGSDVPYLSLADWVVIMDGPAMGDDASEDAPADAPAESDTADAPADGDTADAPAEGDTADAPAEGDAADAPAESDTADAPADGDNADAPSDEELNQMLQDIMNEMQAEGEPQDITFSMEGSVGTLTQPDGYTCDFDCDKDTIHFLDYDAYMRPSEGNFLIDMLGSDGTVDDDGTVHYFARMNNSYERYGKEVTINAGDYGVDFIAQDGNCYVPMQTLSDILLSFYGANIFYNGEVAIVASSKAFGDNPDNATDLADMYYSVEPHDRSEAMAQFSYNELCLVLDTLYGLKDNHGITSFKDLAEDTGLVKGLTSTDSVAADEALYKLLEHHLDDQHTGFNFPSPGSGLHAADSFADDLGAGQSTMRYATQASPYGMARANAFGALTAPVYEEIGNTAYITFDSFDVMPDDVDYYVTPPTEDVKDTMGIMIYAYNQIMREDSPIENVVLDMSCNLGGAANTAVYTIAAFLGVCTVSTRNTLSGALVTANYMIDLNLDGAIDEKDLGLLDKHLFCLESPMSFSCGNLVPCAFKESNMVTLLGRTSGGGACVVQPLTTADGSIFQISGDHQLAFLKNGAFYDVDRGAEPDFPLMRPESFYDREALTEYINNIM